MSAHGRRVLAAFTGVLAGVLIVGPAAAVAGSAVVRYNQVGAFSFVVPAGVAQIHVDVNGGRGGPAAAPATALGGFGDAIVGNLAVTPGAQLTVGVGQGGGAGGMGAGDGGGYSEIRGPTQRYVLAAGGGGAGGGGAGGGAGGAAGAAGINGTTTLHGNGGAAGTGGLGGAGGAPATPSAGAGAPGAALHGGAGGAATGSGAGGGGGGGGIYGGGGGGGSAAADQASGGGGGGASFIAPVVTSAFRSTSSLALPSVTITYEESVAPAVTLDAPAARVGAAPSLTGQAATGGGDAQTVTVRLYPGPSASGPPARTITATVEGSGYTAPTAGLADGTWTARTIQVDSAGNIGQSSARTFTLDTTSPSVALTSPGVGQAIRDPTPTFAGSAGTALGDGGTVGLQLFVGAAASGVPLRSLTTDVAAGAFGITAASLADGTYTVLARQSDDVGNTGVSPPRSFTVDTVAPTVSITAPGPGTVVLQGDPAWATFTCADDRAGLESCVSTVVSGAALDTTTLGLHEIVVTARDRAGNARTERRSYTVVARPSGGGTDTGDHGVTAPTPRPVMGAATAQRRADGGLAIGTARAERKGRTLIVTLAGTVVPAASGAVTVTAKNLNGTRRRLRATIRQGRWRATLRIRLARTTRPARVRLSIVYSGDRTHRATTLERRLTVVRRL